MLPLLLDDPLPAVTSLALIALVVGNGLAYARVLAVLGRRARRRGPGAGR